MKFQGQLNRHYAILLLLVNRFEKFFDRRMQNYPDKFKIINWNSFEVIFNTYSMKQPDLYYFEAVKLTSQA